MFITTFTPEKSIEDITWRHIQDKQHILTFRCHKMEITLGDVLNNIICDKNICNLL